MFGWMRGDSAEDPRVVASGIARALRVQTEQACGMWIAGPLAIGLLEPAGDDPIERAYAPASAAAGRYQLWMAGEVFAAPFVEIPGVAFSRTREFRQALLDHLLDRGLTALGRLDGEFVIALWDGVSRQLRIVNDRFGGLPLYWSTSRAGFAFAGGVRGVLMAPGIASDPDPDAIREAVTFGGYRLGGRTNVSGVQMLAGATALSASADRVATEKYWRWTDIPPVERRPLTELVEEIDRLFTRAVDRRLSGAARPGQTLSGGLDSRAILAAASPRATRWTAITFGVPGCDDARYGHEAATIAGATWVFYPLYSGGRSDWLLRRSCLIQPTDGLIDLVDLMHVDTIAVQAPLIDVHLSGFIGDLVSGPTFANVVDAESLLFQMPYYGGELGLPLDVALERIADTVKGLEGAAPRFGFFTDKGPQSTNRWIAAWRPWLRVRKPFVDYAFFDFCQGLDLDLRVGGALHERWLLQKYPRFFATIPNQKTGMPVMTPRWRIELERARRVARRRAAPIFELAGRPIRPRLRSFTNDGVEWRRPEARAIIEDTILRSDSLCCEIFSRDRVRRVVAAWFERLAAPTQVIGALYVFESYHRHLSAHLEQARTREVLA
jgi:asparagine synthase (glutamine-hydrolysing)